MRLRCHTVHRCSRGGTTSTGQTWTGPTQGRQECFSMSSTTWPQHRLSFEVHAGEMVGLAGLVGAGRSEVMRALFGIDPLVAGEVRLQGRKLELRGPGDAIEAGLALVPEDRKQQGLILEMGIRENIGLAGLRRHRQGGVFLNRSRERDDANRMLRDLKIKAESDRQLPQYLSGGNQQKVVLGKWLVLEPRVLLLDEPTRGVDVGAKQVIYRLMEEFTERGMAILFVSSEMEEVLSMSDRTLVMHEGRIAGELQRHECSGESVMQLATGRSNVPV